MMATRSPFSMPAECWSQEAKRRLMASSSPKLKLAPMFVNAGLSEWRSTASSTIAHTEENAHGSMS